MKILALHCDYIKFQALKKAMKSLPDLSEKEKSEKEVLDCLVILTAVESSDSEKELKEMVSEVKKIAKSVDSKSIVLYPYAHLSSNLSDPDTAQDLLKKAESILKKDFKVTRAPFGYYKTFEFKCKGHPLSELSREFGDKEEKGKTKTKKVETEEKPERLLRQIARVKLDTSKLKDNDHRILGQNLDLFSFSEAAPGSVFWHSKGLVIYNKLIEFWREIHKAADYQEVSTPQILDNKLWKVSGHWQHYKDNIFTTDYEGRDFGVKPMNCPGGMLIYRTNTRSYKDLPLRMAELGIVHRKELSGVLAGLFRVIKFTQDDAHIFCTEEQLESEIEGIIKLAKLIYTTFGFDFSVELSTRPEKSMGEKKTWDLAEKTLESALKKSKTKFKVNKGDGAFYGPKIDFHLKDSLKRTWQCGTIQLDMQMPARFEVTYVGKDNKDHVPLVLHRTIFGSLERFIGILLEHTSGSLPFWLSPVQVRVVSFTDRNIKACEKLIKDLKSEIPSIRIDSDLRSATVNEKIRDSEMQKIPFVLTIGDKEEESKTIAVKAHGEKPKFGVKLPELVKDLKEKIEKRK